MESNKPSIGWINGLQNELLNWYFSARREYPWRQTKDPFKILVAEKLLQQTRANDVLLNSYNQLIEKYPTPKKLAQAKVEEVKVIIKPLGLIFRAQHLIEMANDIQTMYQGEVPNNYVDLIKLKGVGEYCARAVLSFAYHQDVAVVDTNIARFLFRVFNFKELFPANPSRRKFLIEKAQEILPIGKSKEFNFAILDLCALICKPTNPKCIQCPVINYCNFDNKSNKIIAHEK